MLSVIQEKNTTLLIFSCMRTAYEFEELRSGIIDYVNTKQIAAMNHFNPSHLTPNPKQKKLEKECVVLSFVSAIPEKLWQSVYLLFSFPVTFKNWNIQ